MASVSEKAPALWTVVDLAELLGPIPMGRIRFDPMPGTATEDDVLKIHARENRLFELVDGILVEKVMGFRESCIAAALIQLLRDFVGPRKLGTVAAPDGMVRLGIRLVRIPDVSFISWDRLPGRKLPTEPIPQIAPNLAIEVLSGGNTEEEMQRKLREYFAAGVEQVWFVDPRSRTVEVFSSPDHSTVLRGDQILDGAPVLPGLALPLSRIFAELDSQ